MDERITKYLFDILDAINDVESFFQNYPKRFDVFENDILRKSAVERKVEIMGEAINRILRIDSEFPLPNARAIVATRNRVIHTYDKVEPAFLWSLVLRHIPALKEDVNKILGPTDEL